MLAIVTNSLFITSDSLILPETSAPTGAFAKLNTTSFWTGIIDRYIILAVKKQSPYAFEAASRLLKEAPFQVTREDLTLPQLPRPKEQ